MSSSDEALALAINRAGFAGTILAPFGFGIYLLLAGKTIRQQIKIVRKSRQRSHRIIIVYTISMLCLACMWFATGAVDAEYLTVEIPSNPALKMALATCDPITSIRVLSRTIIIWLSDGILLWRTYIIWDGRKAVVVVPLFIYLASIGLGIAFELSCLGKDMGGPISFAASVNIALPFFGLSIGLTIVNTFLITYKLLAHRRELRRGGINSDDALGTYTSLANILVESGSLYTVAGTVFLVLFVLQAPANIPMSVVFTCAAFISPTLIQLRVLGGAAYSEESRLQTHNPNSSVTLNPIRFQSATQSFQHGIIANSFKQDEADQIRSSI